MAEAKTKRTEASVTDYLKRAGDAERQKDCAALVTMMKRAAKAEPKMWGTAIVGFGSQPYEYASGRTGDWPVVAFSSRAQALTLYLKLGGVRHEALVGKLGKCKTGKGCLYIKRLGDVDVAVLEQLIAASVKAAKAKRG